MSSNRHLLLVAAGVSVISLLMVSGAIFLLFWRGLAEQKQHLIDELNNRASMIRAVAEWDYRTVLKDQPEVEDPIRTAWEITRRQIRQAGELFEGLGETGEYVLASLEGDTLVFHLRPRYGEEESTWFLDVDSPKGEPIKRALAGESGYMRGLDYDGVPVYAAYGPLNLNGQHFGLVAKIDVEEIHGAYLQGGLIALGITLPVALLVAVIVFRYGKGLTSKIQETNRRFEGTFEQVGVGLAHVGMDGSWLRVNSKLCDIVGYTKEELYGGRFQDITHPDDLENDLVLFQKLTDGRISTYSINKRYFHKDGHIVWIRLTTAMQRNAEGDRLYCISVVEDITDRKRNEKELEALSQELLESNIELHLQGTALRVAANGIVITDVAGSILWVNPAFEDLYEYSFQELKGKTPRILKSGVQAKAFYREMWETILGGGSWSGELVNRTKSGKQVSVALTITPIFDEEGKLWRFVGIANNITEVRELQQQVIHAQRMEGIGTLAGGIAHDLNNILAPILISSEMLLGRDDLDERTREYLGIIHKSSRRGGDVVSQLLTFARGQAWQKDVFDLTFLVKEMVKMMQETFPRNIRISYHLCEDPEPVFGDPSQLQQVLLNLCVNARDAMPEGGQLTLRLENRDHSGEKAPCCARGVILTVSDTGVGMDPEVRERIFEPFFTTKEIGKGTGLGLSTVVGLVKSHDGIIEVDSVPGKGTTFTLCFPSAVDQQSAEEPGAATDIGSDYPGKGERILLVDDEESILVSLSATLEQAGYRVEMATDGKEGLDRFMASPEAVDLVLTDSNLPNMGGRKMLEFIRQHRPEVPCLVMTGRVDAETENLESAVGEERLLLKPFDPVTLLRLLREALTAKSRSSGPPDS